MRRKEVDHIETRKDEIIDFKWTILIVGIKAQIY